MLPRIVLVLALLALPLAAADKPAPPADLTNPPADAERGDDGLVTKQLVAGKGTEHPGSHDIVRVRYTVWKADGTLVQHKSSAPGRRAATERSSSRMNGVCASGTPSTSDDPAAPASRAWHKA